jgi:hypothetical protein
VIGGVSRRRAADPGRAAMVQRTRLAARAGDQLPRNAASLALNPILPVPHSAALACLYPHLVMSDI